jgi:hypothetical protein
MAKGRDKQRREPKKKPKPKQEKALPSVEFRHHSVPTPAPTPPTSGS